MRAPAWDYSSVVRAETASTATSSRRGRLVPHPTRARPTPNGTGWVASHSFVRPRQCDIPRCPPCDTHGVRSYPRVHLTVHCILYYTIPSLHLSRHLFGSQCQSTLHRASSQCRRLRKRSRGRKKMPPTSIPTSLAASISTIPVKCSRTTPPTTIVLLLRDSRRTYLIQGKSILPTTRTARKMSRRHPCSIDEIAPRPEIPPPLRPAPEHTSVVDRPVVEPLSSRQRPGKALSDTVPNSRPSWTMPSNKPSDTPNDSLPTMPPGPALRPPLRRPATNPTRRTNPSPTPPN